LGGHIICQRTHTYMPHKQRHRGHHANDPKLFSTKWLKTLNSAVDDLSWLLTRGYSPQSSLKLVGDRYMLNKRQRKAVWRSSCSDQSLSHRTNLRIDAAHLQNRKLAIDGYNQLITIESSLAGGMIFLCRDGCFRDIASIHGTYRKVEETLPALILIGEHIAQLLPAQITWYLDAPVSNSGRLKTIMNELAREKNFSWEIELVNNPDRAIIELIDHIAITADGWVLDRAENWFNLSADMIPQINVSEVIDLAGNSASQ